MSYLAELGKRKGILKNLILRDFKLKYTDSILGFAWAFLNPVMIMLVVSFVFTKIIKVGLPDFAFFVLAAIFPWMWFSVSVNESAFAFISQAHLFNQFNIPKEFFVLSSVLANFLNFMLGWCLVLPVFFIFKPHTAALIPVLLLLVILQLLFTFGVALIVSTLNVLLRDVDKLLQTLLMFWFWMTPVFYSVSMVPKRYIWLTYVNPMTPYIHGYRTILFKAGLPSLLNMGAAFGWSLFFLCLGFFVYKKNEVKILKKI